MSHNHLLSDEGVMNRGITFVGKGKAEEEEEYEERIQEDEILVHREHSGVHNNNNNDDDDSSASEAPLLEKKLQEQKSIRRARQISAKQVQQLNQHSRQAYAVPLESNITRTRHHTSDGGGTQKYRTMNGQESQTKHPRSCGEKMIDWINNHNASYSHTLDKIAVSDTVNLNGLSDTYFSSASISNIHSPTNQLRAFRRSLVISDLQGLGKTILADAAYCQQQLCEKPITLSQAISNHEAPPPSEHECEGFDINSYLFAFKEIYTILCLCTPWELEGVSSTERDTFVKRLDQFDDQFTALKLKFIQESDPKRGTTLRCNYRITIQELSDSLLEFADFIRQVHEKIVNVISPTKKSWLPSFGRKT